MTYCQVYSLIYRGKCQEKYVVILHKNYEQSMNKVVVGSALKMGCTFVHFALGN